MTQPALSLPASFTPSALGYSSPTLHLHLHQHGARWVCYAVPPTRRPERYVPDPAASPEEALVAYLVSYADPRLARCWPDGARRAAVCCEALAKSLEAARVATAEARLMLLPMARRYLERARKLRALADGAPHPEDP